MGAEITSPIKIALAVKTNSKAFVITRVMGISHRLQKLTWVLILSVKLTYCSTQPQRDPAKNPAEENPISQNLFTDSFSALPESLEKKESRTHVYKFFLNSRRAFLDSLKTSLQSSKTFKVFSEQNIHGFLEPLINFNLDFNSFRERGFWYQDIVSLEVSAGLMAEMNGHRNFQNGECLKSYLKTLGKKPIPEKPDSALLEDLRKPMDFDQKLSLFKEEHQIYAFQNEVCEKLALNQRDELASFLTITKNPLVYGRLLKAVQSIKIQVIEAHRYALKN
jgi:hypothetical protein